ncbi:hypothetical protein D3C75_710010 [compost metagenome]
MSGHAADEPSHPVALKTIHSVVIVLLQEHPFGQSFPEHFGFGVVQALGDIAGVQLLLKIGHLPVVILLKRQILSHPIPGLFPHGGASKIHIETCTHGIVFRAKICCKSR